MTLSVSTAPGARTATLTDTGPVAAPSGGDVVYGLTRIRPGKPEQVLLVDVPGPATTVTLPSDGVYVLALTAYDAGTEEEPIAPPEPIETATATLLVDWSLLLAGQNLYCRHAREQGQAVEDAGFPLSDYSAIYARRYEAGALLAEGAVDAAQRTLTAAIPPAQ